MLSAIRICVCGLNHTNNWLVFSAVQCSVVLGDVVSLMDSVNYDLFADFSEIVSYVCFEQIDAFPQTMRSS